MPSKPPARRPAYSANSMDAHRKELSRSRRSRWVRRMGVGVAAAPTGERDLARERLSCSARRSHVHRALRLRVMIEYARAKDSGTPSTRSAGIPFHVVADGVALHQRGMRPVDMRAALASSIGPVARYEDRHAVEIGE